MPVGVVKSPRDEKIWRRKVAEVAESRGKKKAAFTSQDWALVNMLFQKAKTKYRGKALPKKYQATASLSDWGNQWVHYTDVNKLGVNPQQFHLDLAGIYLFPKDFVIRGTLWKGKKYKFIVEVAKSARILDLSKIAQPEMESILDKIGIKYDREGLDQDQFWEYLKGYYSLSSGSKKVAKWNRDFRDLGYDAVFDDTGSIHSAEVQLIVLNPKILKVIDVETQNIKRGQFARVSMHLDILASLLQSYGKIEKNLKKEIERYSQGKTKTVGRLTLTLPEGDYIKWQVTEDEANHEIFVAVDDSNLKALRDNWGFSRDSICIPYDRSEDIQKLVERVMQKTGLSDVQASFLHRIESTYNRLVWTPTQVHEKITSVLKLLNSKMPQGSFCQATVEINDDVPVVRVLLGPNDPYTAERVGSFAFYSTARGMEWYTKHIGPSNPPFQPQTGMVFVSYFCDLNPQGEKAVGVVHLNDADEAWVKTMRQAPCPIFQMAQP